MDEHGLINVVSVWSSWKSRPISVSPTAVCRGTPFDPTISPLSTSRRSRLPWPTSSRAVWPLIRLVVLPSSRSLPIPSSNERGAGQPLWLLRSGAGWPRFWLVHHSSLLHKPSPRQGTAPMAISSWTKLAHSLHHLPCSQHHRFVSFSRYTNHTACTTSYFRSCLCLLSF